MQVTEHKLTYSSETPDCATFTILHEDHTLGNAIRYVAMRNPSVTFAGYSIPHPFEPKLVLRIQTKENSPALDAMERSLEDIKSICDTVLDKFRERKEEFDNLMSH
eukprot:TRINITY_DN9611_c0_g1_i1.p1 TRINITY_DN9611_c0_g1~~TRINITY_DN9611_c0_g1_i1.p1  ORF type:complete len:106 (-),score=11.92 TRINITY_DN9611_c0_g1_i1:20-337(-)